MVRSTGGDANIASQIRLVYSLPVSAVPELRPLFRIPGVEPDGCLRITDEFKSQVLAMAADDTAENGKVRPPKE